MDKLNKGKEECSVIEYTVAVIFGSKVFFVKLRQSLLAKTSK